MKGKIFVCKISRLSERDIRNFFEQFGPVVSVRRPFDRRMNRPHSYCFVTFANQEPIEQLLKKERQKVCM